MSYNISARHFWGQSQTRQQNFVYSSYIGTETKLPLRFTCNTYHSTQCSDVIYSGVRHGTPYRVVIVNMRARPVRVHFHHNGGMNNVLPGSQQRTAKEKCRFVACVGGEKWNKTREKIWMEAVLDARRWCMKYYFRFVPECRMWQADVAWLGRWRNQHGNRTFACFLVS